MLNTGGKEQLKQKVSLNRSKNKSRSIDKAIEIDVYSRFSESDLEFVHKEDEENVLYLMDSYNEFNQERKYYD